MNRIFSFLAGALSGALIGSVAALLLTPVSGEQLKNGAVNRWQTAVDDARQAMAEKQRELEMQFEQATIPPHAASYSSSKTTGSS